MERTSGLPDPGALEDEDEDEEGASCCDMVCSDRSIRVLGKRE